MKYITNIIYNKKTRECSHNTCLSLLSKCILVMRVLKYMHNLSCHVHRTQLELNLIEASYVDAQRLAGTVPVNNS